MKRQLFALSRRYQAALRKHLQQGPKLCAQPAHRLGEQAVILGLEPLDLARIHETALTALVRPGESLATRNRTVKRARFFLTEAITPIEETHRAGVETALDLDRQNKTVTQRRAQLAAANRDLKLGIVQRKAAEKALRKSGKRHAKLLRESNYLRKQLRHLTHQLLSAQEEQRMKFSHELQDGVAQTLLGINVRLLTLKNAARGSPAELSKEIARTQRVVKESVRSINRFARELKIRP
jgi:signal transduction histidine kinase